MPLSIKGTLANLTLQKRLSLIVLAGMMIGFVLFSWLGVQSLNESTERILGERLTIARVIASHLEEMLAHVQEELQETHFKGSLPTEERFSSEANSLRKTLANLGIATQNIILTDSDGKILQIEPDEPEIIGMDMSRYPEVKQALETKLPTVSGLVSGHFSEGPVVLATISIFDEKGTINGLLISSIDVRQSTSETFRPVMTLGKTGYTEFIDANGIILTRTKPGLPTREFEKSDHPGLFARLIVERKAIVGTCHQCHATGSELERRQTVLAFAPLSATSWGVAIRQSQEEALAPTRQLRLRLIVVGMVLLVCTFFLMWIMTRGIVKPLIMLTASAKKVAVGDFKEVPQFRRQDEIGQLSAAFYTMTQELAKSRYELVLRNEELKAYAAYVIRAQEEERQRIARELHDEYGQMLTGLMMNVESLENMTASKESLFKEKLKNIKALIVRALEDMRRLTLDLRPSTLDDLGLVATIRSYVQTHLESVGIQVNFESKGLAKRLEPTVETTLFRIIQEAIHNITRHAEAHHVRIQLEAGADKIKVVVEDDGKGFDVEALMRFRVGRQALGLLGIQERVALLGGSFNVRSQVGQGTRLTVEIPIVVHRVV